MNELKYRTPSSNSKMMFNPLNKRMREFGKKYNNQYLYPKNNFNTLQNKNQDATIKKSESSVLTTQSKDIDYFQEYLKQTDYEIGYNTDKLIEDENEDVLSNKSERKLNTIKDYRKYSSQVDEYAQNEEIPEERARARTVMRRYDASLTSKLRISKD